MFNSILDLFFPKVCSGCNGVLLNNEEIICTSCRHELPLTNQHLIVENEMYLKFYGILNLQHASAMLYFHKKELVQNLIHNLKYKGHQEIGKFLGEWYAEDLKEVPKLQTIDAIIPVPLHKKRQKERGYNQVDLFCKALSVKLQVEYNTSLVERIVYTKSQTLKKKQKRKKDVEQIFDIKFTEKDHGKHYLLVDDVMTTGSTLESCSRTLLQIPGSKVSLVCIAMVL